MVRYVYPGYQKKKDEQITAVIIAIPYVKS
jgi:hypothetical protein